MPGRRECEGHCVQAFTPGLGCSPAGRRWEEIRGACVGKVLSCLVAGIPPNHSLSGPEKGSCSDSHPIDGDRISYLQRTRYTYNTFPALPPREIVQLRPPHSCP